MDTRPVRPQPKASAKTREPFVLHACLASRGPRNARFRWPHHTSTPTAPDQPSPPQTNSKTIKMQFAKVLVALAAGAAAFTAPTASKVSKVVVRGMLPSAED